MGVIGVTAVIVVISIIVVIGQVRGMPHPQLEK
jgi:hypothetical protein